MDLKFDEYTGIIGVISGIIGSVWGWFAGRKKERASYKESEVNVGVCVQKLYDGLVEDMEHRFQAMKKEILELKQEIALWKQKYTRLSKEFQIYKKNQAARKNRLHPCPEFFYCCRSFI